MKDAVQGPSALRCDVGGCDDGTGAPAAFQAQR